MKEKERPEVPVEGILYAEIAAWITIIGMIAAAVGLIVGFFYGGGIINDPGLLKDLFVGRGEGYLWTRDSAFADMPQQYWFFRHRMDGDEMSMLGMVIACYGGIAGTWAMFLSMFRRKEVLLYKKGLYTILTLIMGVILTLAATRG